MMTRGRRARDRPGDEDVRVGERAPDLLPGLVAALGLLAIAALLSWGTYRGTDHETAAFYLAAAVIATWFGGLPAGAVIVLGGSVLSVHTRSPDPQAWETTRADWTRLAAFAVVAAGYIVLLERVRAASRSLSLALQQQRAILELLPVGVAIVEASGRAARPRINAALVRMLAGSSSPEPARAAQAAHAPAALPLLGSLQAPGDEHLELRKPDGSAVYIHARAEPLVDQGERRGAVAVYIDETESRERELELRRASQAKDEFLGMISHELKTPLTIISGNAEILERRLAGEDGMLRDALEDMRDASTRLLSNVDNLLTLARIGDRNLELEPFPLCRTLERVVASSRRFDHPIELRCPGHLFAVGVPEVVEQVLHNLVANALKYSSPNQPVEIDVSHSMGEFQIAVRDRGAGIPPEQLEAVFAAFYRSPDTSDMATGMGVGLAVCRALVAAMGGRMWASARIGGGSEFVFTLAVATDEQDETPG